jgi:hypothetical protein
LRQQRLKDISDLFCSGIDNITLFADRSLEYFDIDRFANVAPGSHLI